MTSPVTQKDKDHLNLNILHSVKDIVNTAKKQRVFLEEHQLT
jgi:hypothetical protein